MNILIFYASYGGGHLSTANALKEALEKNYENMEVEVFDCMEYLNKFINCITVKSYEGLAKKMPKAWGMIYKASRKGLIASISNGTNKMLAGKLGKLIEIKAPDLIISAHPFSSQMCGILKKKGKLNLKVATVMTDFKYHEQWLVRTRNTRKIFRIKRKNEARFNCIWTRRK